MSTTTEQRRVWVYQANRFMTDTETHQAQAYLDAFNAQWKAHQVKLAARISVLHHLFVIIEVDQAHQEATGCAIDTSVKMMQELGNRLGIDFFDRQMIAYQGQEGSLHLARLPELAQHYAEGKLTDESMVYNNLVDNGEDFDQKWRQPLKASWIARFV